MRCIWFGLVLVCAACDGGSPDLGDAGGAVCELIAETTATGSTSPSGCALIEHDTSACDASRAASGLEGFWLEFSCRVSLTNETGAVRAAADGLPTHRSNYFRETDPCWEEYTAATQNPNFITAQSYTIDFPSAPSSTATAMTGAVVGLALDGVPIYGNFAAPGDDIFTEALTFDRCGAHPQRAGSYHYHSEPYALSYDDSRFIGVIRDGYPIYGRRDPDGSVPADLDAQGGHTSATLHSVTPVYHYHVNEQTSTSPGTSGQMQWFLTTGTYHGSPGACTGCN